MSLRSVYVYRSFERFWHWMQATLIFFLAFTGFEIHGTYTFFGFRNAVAYHNLAAYAFIILIILAIFWHFSTGEWKQYVPTFEHMRAQLNYYIFGIFRNAPHPIKKSVLRKLNPLQKLTYFGLKINVIPVIVTTGLLYMFYRYPQHYGVEALNIESLELIAVIHTIGAFVLVIFVVGHLYLITTGETATSNLKAMLTGYDNLDEKDTIHENAATPSQKTEQVTL